MYRRNKSKKRNCSCMNEDKRNCPHCEMPDFMPRNPQLAKAYVPYQDIDDTFCPAESLNHGTTFPELVSPYRQNQSQCTINYLRGTKTCEEADHCE